MGTGEGDPGALTVTDILTDGWYDYDAKYKPGGSRHVVPADIPARSSRPAWITPPAPMRFWAAGA
jgi:D-alanine-D-alanine ligase-like ATP-grasp enzyme